MKRWFSVLATIPLFAFAFDAQADRTSMAGHRYTVPMTYADSSPLSDKDIKRGEEILRLRFIPASEARMTQSSTVEVFKASGKKAKHTVNVEEGLELFGVETTTLDGTVFCSGRPAGIFYKQKIPLCFIDADSNGAFDKVSAGAGAGTDSGPILGGRLAKIFDLGAPISYEAAPNSETLSAYISITFDDKKSIKSNFVTVHDVWADIGVLHRAAIPQDAGDSATVKIVGTRLDIIRTGKKTIRASELSAPNQADVYSFSFDNHTAVDEGLRMPTDPKVFELAISR